MSNVRSMKAISFPVRPPSLPSVLPTPLAAPAMAGPAALVTRERPWDALAVVSLATSAAFWVVVLSKRRVAICLKAGERSMGRARDMVEAISSDFLIVRFGRVPVLIGVASSEGSSRARRASGEEKRRECESIGSPGKTSDDQLGREMMAEGGMGGVVDLAGSSWCN